MSHWPLKRTANSTFDEHCVDDWEAMVDVNLKGVLFGIAAALPVFRRQGFGHFVNIASTAAFQVTPGQSAYAGTKMAVRAISEGLRQEAGENPARPLRTHRAETPRSEPSKRKSDVLGMDSLSYSTASVPMRTRRRAAVAATAAWQGSPLGDSAAGLEEAQPAVSAEAPDRVRG